jgi:hypothetical protein
VRTNKDEEGGPGKEETNKKEDFILRSLLERKEEEKGKWEWALAA